MARDTSDGSFVPGVRVRGMVGARGKVMEGGSCFRGLALFFFFLQDNCDKELNPFFVRAVIWDAPKLSLQIPAAAAPPMVRHRLEVTVGV